LSCATSGGVCCEEVGEVPEGRTQSRVAGVACELRDRGGISEAWMLLEMAFEPVEFRDVEHP
jgi:hypothetical protein